MRSAPFLKRNLACTSRLALARTKRAPISFKRAVVSKELWKLSPMATTQRSKFPTPKDSTKCSLVASPIWASVTISMASFTLPSSLSIAKTSFPSSINFAAMCLPKRPSPIRSTDFIFFSSAFVIRYREQKLLFCVPVYSLILFYYYLKYVFRRLDTAISENLPLHPANFELRC